MKKIVFLILCIFIIPSCEKIKERCRQILEPKIDEFAISLAKECKGDVEKSKAYFAKAKRICAMPLMPKPPMPIR